MPNKIPELLAPAGSMESVYAAVRGGANAVYFGGKTANARNAAKNFTMDEIFYAADLLHGSGMRAYITLNILHTDREIPTVLKFAEDCLNCGADAFIIQDLGLSRIIGEYFPEAALHASTQAAGHNAEAAKKFAGLGFSRMVAARELDYANLKYIIENSPIETEMFAHGALCSSHSGRCFMSYALGGSRSANRGTCAQPCRMEYNGKYSLSLKDLCLAGRIKEIISLAPAGIKIEGRMKSPEYVYNVCRIYRACLDENRNAAGSEIDFLAKIFSRQGFTDGYFTHNLGAHMYGVRTDENKRESKKISRSSPAGRQPAKKGPPPSGGYARVSAPGGQPILKKFKNIKINPKLCLIFAVQEQFFQIMDFLETEEIFKKIYRIFLPLGKNDREIPRSFADISGRVLPCVIFDGEKERVKNLLESSKPKHVLADNIGHTSLLSGDFGLFGDFGLNAANSYTVEQYKKIGFQNIILSPELNFAQIRDINKCINCGITAYGKTRLMVSENRIVKNSGYLTDKTGAGFFVLEDCLGRNMIYNSFPVYLADKKDLYKNIGLYFISLNFTDENPGQIKQIISDYASNKDDIRPPEKFTRAYR